MQVNDLIFKELMKRGYSLEGKTRVWNIADSKLWYLTPEQAQAYLDLEKFKEYSKPMFETEIKMLEELMPEIEKIVLQGSSINIIDIGCGDGKKAVPVINALEEKTKIRYCPIDISSHMVSKAIDKITKLNKGEVVQFKWNISDFDNLDNVSSLLRDKNYRENLFLFLGSTLSNFEMHEVMYEIVEAMEKRKDYLLIGIALSTSTPEEIIKSYKIGQMSQFLSLTLKQIGFTDDELEFGTRYKNSRVEMYFSILKDKKINFGAKSIYFTKEDQILVAISYRYDIERLKDSMKLYFNTPKFFVNKDQTWALILCKK